MNNIFKPPLYWYRMLVIWNRKLQRVNLLNHWESNVHSPRAIAWRRRYKSYGRFGSYAVSLRLGYLNLPNKYLNVINCCEAFDCECPLITDKHTEMLDCIPCVKQFKQESTNRHTEKLTDGCYQTYYLSCFAVNKHKTKLCKAFSICLFILRGTSQD